MSDRKNLSRAELVRLRREEEHANEMKRALKEITRPVPAVTRAKPKAKKPRRKSVRNTRRRFQVVLPHASNMNMRSFSIPRPRFGWRFISLILVAFLGAAIYFAFEHPALRVTEAQVTGNQMLTLADIKSVLNVAGQPVFLLIPSDLETRLRLNYPELASVRVSVSLPNIVSVNVTERQPVIRWEQGDGYTWVAQDGVAFRPRGEMIGLISIVAVSAPPVADSVVDPLTPAPFISTEMVDAIKGLASHVPPGAPILYDAAYGFGWNDPRGWRVYFGTSARDVELKMRVYESMVSSLTQRGIHPALINVTYPTAPYYRMTQ